MKVLVTNVFGDFNKGDKALVETLVSTLLKHKIEEISLVAIFNEHLDSIEGVNRVYRPFHRLLIPKKFLVFLYPFILFSGLINMKFRKGFRWMLNTNQKALLDAYRDTDLVVSCPGGFLEDSNKSYFLNLYQLVLGVINKNRLVIAPQSIGPITSPLGRKLLKFVLHRCDKIFVRETFSENFLIDDIKIDKKKVILSTDMAFFMPEIDLSPAKDFEVMYSTVVNWSFPESDNKKQARNNYISSLVEIYSYINEKYKKNIVLLNQVATDLPIAYEIKELIPAIVTVDETSYTPEEMITKISKTTFFIGPRFHSCIFSMMSKVPFIAISYLPKTKGILDWMGLADYNVDIYKIDPEVIKKKLVEISGNEDYHINLIKEKVSLLKENDTFSAYLDSINNG